jgi:hypothetical protein
MYKFLTNYRWFRKLLGRNWELLGSITDETESTWFNWDLVITNPLMMRMVDDGIVTILKSESY